MATDNRELINHVTMQSAEFKPIKLESFRVLENGKIYGLSDCVLYHFSEERGYWIPMTMNAIVPK